MKAMRNLIAGLLALSGTLHLVAATQMKLDAAGIITIVFGLAYLVMAFSLLRSGRLILWLGVFVPLVGLVLAVIGMLMSPNLLGVVFILIDILAPAGCAWLLGRKETSTGMAVGRNA